MNRITTSFMRQNAVCKQDASMLIFHKSDGCFLGKVDDSVSKQYFTQRRKEFSAPLREIIVTND